MLQGPLEMDGLPYGVMMSCPLFYHPLKLIPHFLTLSTLRITYCMERGPAISEVGFGAFSGDLVTIFHGVGVTIRAILPAALCPPAYQGSR